MCHECIRPIYKEAGRTFINSEEKLLRILKIDDSEAKSWNVKQMIIRFWEWFGENIYIWTDNGMKYSMSCLFFINSSGVFFSFFVLQCEGLFLVKEGYFIKNLRSLFKWTFMKLVIRFAE